MDDDGYFPYHSHSSYSFRHAREEQRSGGGGWFTGGDSATQYGLAIALIVLFQFRATWLSWIRQVRDRYRGLGPWEVVWDLWECSHAFWYASWDTLRVFVSHTDAGGGGWLDVNDALPSDKSPPRRPASASTTALLGSSSMPELEDVPDILCDDEEEEEDSVRASGSTPKQRVLVELEPAFLREEDYPEGWMVYHPILGVVLKTEADKYRREQEPNCRMERMEEPRPLPPMVTSS